MNLNTLYHLIRGPERQEIAERAGVSLSTLQVWAKKWANKKTGHVRIPTREQIRTLAKADKRLTVRELREEFYPKAEEKAGEE